MRFWVIRPKSAKDRWAVRSSVHSTQYCASEALALQAGLDLAADYCIARGRIALVFAERSAGEFEEYARCTPAPHRHARRTPAMSRASILC